MVPNTQQADRATEPAPFSQRGPYRVGLREIEFPSLAEPARRLPTSVWYPAKAPRPVDDELPEQAPHLLGQPHQADLDLEPDDFPAPLIVFSHGNSGSRHQSTFLMTHLASWGFVVAAPDHLGNTFFDSAERLDPEEIRAAHRRARALRPLDMIGVLRGLVGYDDSTSVRDTNEPRDALPLLPPVDPTRLGALGHSFGGWTTLKLPQLDRRLRALCCLAPATEPFVGRVAFEPKELPLEDSVETLVLAAGNDVLVDLETSILPLSERLGGRARLEVVDGLDHFHFCDGIALLHQMHFNAPRPGQLRATLPYESLRSERATHAWLNQRVTQFFRQALRCEEVRREANRIV